MSEKTAKRAYQNVQYNKMESSQYSKRKDRLGRRASDWMHQKPYGMQDTEGEESEGSEEPK